MVVVVVVIITIAVQRLDIRWFSWRWKVEVASLDTGRIMLYQWCAA
jgi:hypothetical protein